MENDASLLGRYAADQDAAAFAEVVRRYAGLVFAVARRVTGNAAAAEDVAQDCFLALARQAGTIEESLAGWLHRVAFRRALDVKRNAATRRRHEAGAAALRADGAAPEGPGWKEIEPRVDTALAALPEEMRVPLVEHYLGGRSQAEIARGMNLDPSTVSRRIEKGIEAVRRKLSRGGAAVPAVLVVAMLGHGAAAPPALRAALGKMAVAGVAAPAPVPVAAASAGQAPAFGPFPAGFRPAPFPRPAALYAKGLLIFLLAAVVAGLVVLGARMRSPTADPDVPRQEPARE